MKKEIFFVVLLSITNCLGQEDICPDTSISPCTCKTYFDGACIITCGLAPQAILEKIADIPNLCNGHVHFILVHSKVSGLPAKLWEVLLSSKTVDITIKHSAIEGLVPPGSENIPDVYSQGEAIIKIDHMKVERWDWEQLQNFYSEEELTLVVDDTPLPGLNEDFSRLAKGQVHKITLDSTGLESIPDRIFANFEDLTSLSLQNNKLTSVSRSIIARPAKRLHFLHLTGNMLTMIPGDLFADMPELEEVYLRDNQLKTLPQDLFQNVDSKGIQRLDFVHNPWECDCRLMWILKNSKVYANLGTCATPESVAQKKVRDLPKLLDC